MTIEKAVKTCLEANDFLRNRVFSLSISKDEVPPFVLIVPTGLTEIDCFDGGTGLFSAEFDVCITARSIPNLITLARTVRATLLSMEETEKDNLIIEKVTVIQSAPDGREWGTTYCSRVYDLHIDYQEV